MKIKSSKKILASDSSVFANSLYIVASITTLLLHVGFLDPVNRPKLAFLTLAIIPLLLIALPRLKYNSSREFLIPLLLPSILLLAFATYPFVGNGAYESLLLGSRGRQLGSLAYLMFVLCMVLAYFFWNSKKGQTLIYIFALLVVLEVLYGLIQFSGRDFIGWTNPYSPIIQTFGNPNFASAFNGIGAIVLFYLAFLWRSSWTAFVVFAGTALVAIYLIIKSSSTQGLFAFGIILVFFAIKIAFDRRKVLGLSLLLLSFVGGLFVVLGLLNQGPLARLVYQSSISARGDYWRAALSMIKSNPVFGVGLDNFGSYFGAHRDLIQVTNRGYATFSDNAHNVLLQLAATGGMFVFLPYLALLCFITYCCVFLSLKLHWQKNLVEFLVIGMWLSSTVISLISIDNIGFTLWNWIFGGIILRCYSNVKSVDLEPTLQVSLKKARLIQLLLGSAFILVATIFVTPMVRAEVEIKSVLPKIYSSSNEAQAKTLSDRVISTFPRDYIILAQLSSAASQKRYSELSIDYADKGLKLNSRSTELLRFKAAAYDDLKDHEKAALVRESIRVIDPYNINNLALLSQDYVFIGDINKAKMMFDEMNKILPNNEFRDVLTKMIAEREAKKS